MWIYMLYPYVIYPFAMPEYMYYPYATHSRTVDPDDFILGLTWILFDTLELGFKKSDGLSFPPPDADSHFKSRKT